MSELDTFIKEFQYEPTKVWEGRKAEFRAQDLDSVKVQAKNLINKLGLNLTVVSTGVLASYRVFEVHVNL